MDRQILHSDINSFYASVEQMLNPDLRNKPIAVCGSTDERHGIVLAKSQEAKIMGVKTAMVNWEAKQLCPNLIIVKPNYSQYVKYSKLTRHIYERYTDLIEPFGMDESWLDVSSSQNLYGSGLDIAEKIRQSVKEELGFTVSIGVSYNKIFAKLGSDMKKPDAITLINREDLESKIWPLPVSELLYCGRATTKKLLKYNIKTIGDLGKSHPSFLKQILGVNGLALWTYANGKDVSRVMHKEYEIPAKSVGHGITCTSDLVSDQEVWKVMFELCQDVGHKLREYNLKATGVQLSIRNTALFIKQYQAPLTVATQSPYAISLLAKKLFDKNYGWEADIRSLTVRAINLISEKHPQQLSLFTNPKQIDRQNRLETAIDGIRGRFGKKSIQHAVLMGDLKMPGRDIHEISLPAPMFK
ncbi:MAG: DNA polymerase IV [Eubacteriaceae bacterium]